MDANMDVNDNYENRSSGNERMVEEKPENASIDEEIKMILEPDDFLDGKSSIDKVKEFFGSEGSDDKEMWEEMDIAESANSMEATEHHVESDEVSDSILTNNESFIVENGEEMPSHKTQENNEEQIAQTENQKQQTLTTVEPLSDSQERKVEEDIEKFLSAKVHLQSNGSDHSPTKDQTGLNESSTSLKRRVSSTESDEGKKSSIVDSLLDKIRKNSDSSVPDMGKIEQMLSESDDDLLVEINRPVCLKQPTNPNQMPTPFVSNQNSRTSAFVNNEEEYHEAVSNKRAQEVVRVIDKNQMGQSSKIPSMTAPQLPSNIAKPRTVAEKRVLVNQNSIKYLMVEQESKIFKQVKRKEHGLDINYSVLDNIMAEDIPINTGPWRVLTWLRTREGNFIQTSANVDGEIFKLRGSRGDQRIRTLNAQSSKPLPKFATTKLRSTRCCVGCRIAKPQLDRLTRSTSIRNFFLGNNIDNHKRMDVKFLDNQLVSIKPRPLSKKIEILNNERKSSKIDFDEDGAFLGNYEKFTMPDIILEVNVKPKASLDPQAKKYLKEILPHRELDENWCKFALTALATDSEEDSETRLETFQFIIPYQNNKNCILVREIERTSEDTECLRIFNNDTDECEDEMEWTFDKNCDKEDPVECEIVEIIKDLTNSVFINLNDNLFTAEDTVRVEEDSESSALKSQEAVQELSNLPAPNRSKRVLMELKRLNANFYQPESFVDNENDLRRHATAHLGREERDLRPTVIVTDSETVLLPNHDKESRRIKRAPKKFDDYQKQTKSQSDEDEPVAKKGRFRSDSQNDSFKARLTGGYFNEDQATVRDGVRKMIHVKVPLRKLFLPDVACYCMVHGFYKCHCKNERPAIQPEFPVVKQVAQSTSFKTLNQTYIRRNSINYAQFLSKQKAQNKLLESNEEESCKVLADDGFSRRVLPVEHRNKETDGTSSATLNSSAGAPKLEIQNLCDLINGGPGPIFINVFNDKTMRLNPILRSVLNNNSAIVYFDNSAYFVDKRRVNVKSLDFQSVMQTLESPIFILQGKEAIPGPASTSDTEELEKVMFKPDMQKMIRIFDPISLNSIANIIELILLKVRKKIESKIGQNRSDLVNDQLSKLTRNRTLSRSSSTSTINSSASSTTSTHSSPLSFKGLPLQEAPPPGNNTSMMLEFNKVFSTRMQKIVSLIGTNTLGLHPSNEMLNKFYIYQWSLLLRSYEENLVQIWQATIKGESEERYQLLVLTDSNEIPNVENVEQGEIINIRTLSISDNITELTRMILLRVEKASLKNMTILMFGCKGYLRICGILNSKDEYLKGFAAKPTRSTHPRLTEKIQKVYKIWHESRSHILEKKLAEERKKEEEKQALALERFIAQRKIDDLRDQAEVTEAVNSITSPSKKTIRTYQKSKPEILKSPSTSGPSNFKWFLFNITDDFSDIYIKTWSRYLSYKVIMEAVQRAKTQGRAVALVPSNVNIRKWPKIYALPGAPLKFKEQTSMTSNYLIFGPYVRNANSNLLLMQNYDGRLILRDDYEKLKNIKRKTKTRCLWIYANTLKCIQEADPVPLKLMWGPNEIIRPNQPEPK